MCKASFCDTLEELDRQRCGSAVTSPAMVVPQTVAAGAGQALREPSQRCPASFIAGLSTYGQCRAT